MKPSFVHALLIAGFGSIASCSSGASPPPLPRSGAAGAVAGTAGAGAAGAGAAGASAAAGAGAAGTSAAAGAGAPGTAGASTAGAGGATAGVGGATADAAAGEAGADDGGSEDAGVVDARPDAGKGIDLTQVVPTAGCRKDAPAALVPGTLVRQTMQTIGVKDPSCADSKCGAWSYLREYYVRLPAGYDNAKAYPMVIEGPGCGGYGDSLYSIPVFDSTVIRVGLSPSAEAQAFHATNPGQGCFDDKEGDDSIEWIFYEQLHDLLASTVCFDRNRVFAAGNSSGAWLANELGCKYAGDATRPIRGVMPNAGGLPTDARYAPTCTQAPLAGMWTYETDVTANGVNYQLPAINRALKVNGCSPAGVMLQSAKSDDFPVPGNPAATCQKLSGCPAVAPLVVCSLAGTGHPSNATLVGAGWPAFVQLFSASPLLTP